MLCANQEQLRTVLAFLRDAPADVLCDWLPWNHTFGGNHNFGMVLYNGGTLYIDAGPAGAGADGPHDRESPRRGHDGVLQRAARLRAAAPRPPRGRGVLPALLQPAPGAVLRRGTLRPEIADGMQELAIASTGRPVPWITGLGATESAPFAHVHGAAALDRDARGCAGAWTSN